MATPLPPDVVAFLTKEAGFVYNLYQAAESEVRMTEGYVLVGLGGIYSYLATKKGRVPFGRIAWFIPTFIVAFAGLRALWLGVRQAELLKYLEKIEANLLQMNASLGWATSFRQTGNFMSVTAGAFYVLLLIVTIVVACIQKTE